MRRPDDPLSLNLARIVFRLLTSARGWQVRELKRELGISDRTYRKYRKILQDRFTPLFDGRGKSLVREVEDADGTHLRIVDGPDVETTDSTLLASMSALQLVRQAFRFLSGTELQKAVDALYATLRERVSDKRFVLGHLFRNLDRMLHSVPDAPKDYSKQAEKLRAILHGLIHTRRLAVSYEGSGGPKSHELEPLSLVMHRSALYLLAQHSGDDRKYTFAIDRIRSVEPMKLGFRYPSPSDFDPALHYEGAFGVFVPPAKKRRRTAVELVFANQRWLKLYVQERRWHPTQQFSELRDGRLRMSFRVDNMIEVWPWIRSFGPDVRVVLPRAVETT